MNRHLKKGKVGLNTWLLATSCFLAYTSCYAGRSILSAIMPQMIAETHFTRGDLGTMGSAFFLTYGAGQLVNGVLGDRIGAKHMVPFGLFFTGILLALFSPLESTSLGVLLWAFCGLLLSMLWGPLSKVIAENTSTEVGTAILTSLNVASILGTSSAYMTAAYGASRGSFRIAFLASAVVLTATALIWYVILTYLEKQNAITSRKDDSAIWFTKELAAELVRKAFLPVLLVSMVNGIIRNAVAFWIPTFLSERLGFSPALSASISGGLPLVNLAGTFLGLVILKKLRGNEFRTIGILFGASTAAFTLAILFSKLSALLVVFMLFVACGAMSSACNLIFASYCLRFKDTGRMSAVTGLLNFSAYAASALASAGFGAVISSFGWSPLTLSWVLLSLVGAWSAFISEKVFFRKKVH